MDIGNKLLPLSVETGVTQCDVGASLHSKTHSLFMYNIIVHYVYALMPSHLSQKSPWACIYKSNVTFINVAPQL